MTTVDTINLNDDTAIPQIGLGTWQLIGKEGYKMVKTALEVGYRHIDTAYYYGNHQEVGRAIADSNVDRNDIFLTTKIWRDSLRPDALQAQFQESLNQLDTDYVDLLLIHWPNQSVPVTETVSAMADLREKGQIKAFGVSNFTTDLLQDALKVDSDVAVNQVEFHPSFNQSELLGFCHDTGVTVTAYSPLGRGQDLTLDTVQDIADDIDGSASQVIISWLNRKGIVAIPKASSRTHIKENFQAADVTLTSQQVQRLDQRNADNRLISPSFAPFA